MTDAHLEENDGNDSIGREILPICDLPMKQELQLRKSRNQKESLVDSLAKTCIWHNMEISAEKIKLMTNIANGIQREIKVKRQKLGTVTSFKHFEAVVSDDG